MPNQQRAHPPQNQQAGNGNGQPGAQNPPNNGTNHEEEEAPPPNVTPEQTREYIARLQLDRTNTKRRLADVTRERDQLATAAKSKRCRARYVNEPTIDSPKSDKAGKRCALMHLLWVSPEIFETQIDPPYTADRRSIMGARL